MKSYVIGARMGSKYASTFIWMLFKPFISLNHFTFFIFIKLAAKYLILNYLILLNTIPLTRIKMLINNLLMSFQRTT